MQWKKIVVVELICEATGDPTPSLVILKVNSFLSLNKFDV